VYGPMVALGRGVVSHERGAPVHLNLKPETPKNAAEECSGHAAGPLEAGHALSPGRIVAWNSPFYLRILKYTR
jgi:hypothetical protein